MSSPSIKAPVDRTMADYTVTSDGKVIANGEVKLIAQRFRAADAARRQMELRWTAAELGRLFVLFPWLSAMTLNFSVSAEYDDNGGSYRSISLSISGIAKVVGVALDSQSFPQGLFDEDVAEELLLEELQDEEFDLYSSLGAYPDSFDDLACRVTREDVYTQLSQPEVSAAALCSAWQLGEPPA